MPRAIIRQLKRGQIPKPEIFDNTTVFFSDIVSFTQVYFLPVNLIFES
jgi:class 3 adenylate cyclase